jgi:hypothetical protein
MGCSTPLMNSQKHSAWPAGGRASVPITVATARNISRSRPEYMSDPDEWLSLPGFLAKRMKLF